MADKSNANQTFGSVTRLQNHYSVEGLPQDELEGVFSSLEVNEGRSPYTIDAGENVSSGASTGPQGSAGVNVSESTALRDLVQLELLKL